MKLFRLILFCGLLYTTCRAQIQVMSVIDHVIPWSPDTAGNIYPTVSGGTSPYSYKWDPGAITSTNLTNAAINSYTLKVVDSTPDSVYYYYNLGYKTEWTYFYGSVFRNDTIMTDGTGCCPADRTAITKNTLPAYTDGWCQYVVESFTAPYLLGFIDHTSSSTKPYNTDIDFAFHVTYGNNLYHWSALSGYFTWLGTVQAGDVLRLERVDSTYYLRKNEVSLISASTNNNRLKIKAQLHQHMSNIGVSFTDSNSVFRLESVVSIVEHVDCYGIDGFGNIYPEVRGGATPISYSWTPGGSTNDSLLSAGRDLYTLKVKDYNNDSLIYYYELGFTTDWNNFYGTMFRNDSLMSDGTGSYVNRTALSINELPEYTDGWVEYIAPEFTSPYLVGFLDSAMVVYIGGHEDTDFSFHETYGNNLYAWSSGYFTWLGTVQEGDALRLERIDSTFYLKKNNVTLYTDAAPANRKLKIKGLIGTAPLSKVGASFPVVTPYCGYAVLRKSLDGGFYDVTSTRNPSHNGILYFRFEEEYVDNGNNLDYRIYKDLPGDATALMGTPPALPVTYKDNRYAITLGIAGINLTSGIYILEVTDKKGEKTFLRFKY